MANVSEAMQAKSDQLNAVDLGSAELILKITGVNVSNGDQPVSVFYEGDHNRPWKPSKGMIRVLATAWGNETNEWIGKSALVWCDPTVKWAGKEVGGIRIKALSHINTKGIDCLVTLNRQQREKKHIEFLDATRPAYPDDKFNAGFEAMVAAMNSQKMTLQQIIARCQQTGDLTEEQLKRLQDAAPVEIEENEED